MQVSPFPFHGPLEPDQVIGRDDIVRDLIERMTTHRPTVLLAPRRYGKTSILGRVAAELEATTTVIRVDLYELRSWADLAARLDDALVRTGGEGRRGLDRIASTLELNLGFVKASFARPDRPDPDTIADRLLDVIVTHARRSPTVLVFDEFSSVVRVDGASGLLRTKLQHQFASMGLMFAGSEPSTMRMLFADVDQPFYAQADLVELPGLDLATVTELIERGFDDPTPGDLAGTLHAFAGGHPQRTMQLADAVWRARASGTPDPELWETALDDVRRATEGGFELRFTNFATAEQAVMRLAAGDGVLHGRDAELLALSSSSADAAKRTLLARGQIALTPTRRVSVIDPLFADWLRRRFTL